MNEIGRLIELLALMLDDSQSRRASCPSARKGTDVEAMRLTYEELLEAILSEAGHEAA